MSVNPGQGEVNPLRLEEKEQYARLARLFVSLLDPGEKARLVICGYTVACKKVGAANIKEISNKTGLPMNEIMGSAIRHALRRLQSAAGKKVLRKHAFRTPFHSKGEILPALLSEEEWGLVQGILDALSIKLSVFSDFAAQAYYRYWLDAKSRARGKKAANE